MLIHTFEVTLILLVVARIWLAREEQRREYYEEAPLAKPPIVRWTLDQESRLWNAGEQSANWTKVQSYRLFLSVCIWILSRAFCEPIPPFLIWL